MANTNHGKWEYNGEFKTLSAWAKYFGKHRYYFYYRFRHFQEEYEKGNVAFHGFKLDALINLGVPERGKKYTVNGETHTLKEWEEITGNSPILVHNRINCWGWKVEDAIIVPKGTHHGGHEVYGSYKSDSEWYQLYKRWASLRARCRNLQKDPKKKTVTFYDDWESFEIFRDWSIKNGYEKGKWLLRKDSYVGYCPENCFWGDKSEVNRKNCKSQDWEYNGKKDSLAGWAKVFGKSKPYFSCRLRFYMQDYEAGKVPFHEYKLESLIEYTSLQKYTVNGETHTLPEWSKILGISRQCLFMRLKKGWSVEDTFTKSLKQIKRKAE